QHADDGGPQHHPCPPRMYLYGQIGGPRSRRSNLSIDPPGLPRFICPYKLPAWRCEGKANMADTGELYARGLRRRQQMFGAEEVEKRMAAAGAFGAPLQRIINAYVYGDVWERSDLSDDIRSLVMLGITAASGKTAEFRVHAQGALKNGCSREQVQGVLLL